MKMRRGTALGVGWEGDEMEDEIEVCGAHSPRGIDVCDEPCWMGPHTWHTALSQTGWQWCSCGRDHHYAEDCEAVVALRETPEWLAFVNGKAEQ